MGVLMAATVGGGLGPLNEPSWASVRSTSFWTELQRSGISDDKALQYVRRGIAADRRHMHAWRWLLQICLRHMRRVGPTWPSNAVDPPSSWVTSDNGSFWHLRAALLAQQLEMLGRDEQEELLREELVALESGLRVEPLSESRGTFYRHVCTTLRQLPQRRPPCDQPPRHGPLGAFTPRGDGPRGTARLAVDTTLETRGAQGIETRAPAAHYRLLFTGEAVRNPRHACVSAGAPPECDVDLSRQALSELRSCDPLRAGMYKDLEARVARLSIAEPVQCKQAGNEEDA